MLVVVEVGKLDEVEENQKCLAQWKIYNKTKKTMFRGSFQVMGRHVLESPEESNDQTQ